MLGRFLPLLFTLVRASSSSGGVPFPSHEEGFANCLKLFKERLSLSLKESFCIDKVSQTSPLSVTLEGTKRSLSGESCKASLEPEEPSYKELSKEASELYVVSAEKTSKRKAFF
jgi:hypothetical protein